MSEARGAGRGRGESEERRALLDAARGGDARAFEALFAPDMDLAWRMACRVAGDASVADDALQEGLLAAFRNLDRVRPENLRGWFVRIVENAARDARRRERRRPSIPLPMGAPPVDDGSLLAGTAPEPRAGEESDPAVASERRELARALADALARISAERRMAILLYDVDGYDYAEIAEICGVSVGTVKSRISRGRRELRPLLDEQLREAGNRRSGNGVGEGR